MSTQALIMLADALEQWVKRQEFEKSVKERVTTLEAQGLNFSEAELSILPA
jgi:protein-arginine kinase activator protein McsA